MSRLKHLGPVAILAAVIGISGCGDGPHVEVDLGPDVDMGWAS